MRDLDAHNTRAVAHCEGTNLPLQLGHDVQRQQRRWGNFNRRMACLSLDHGGCLIRHQLEICLHL